jgi:hypothetical protein
MEIFLLLNLLMERFKGPQVQYHPHTAKDDMDPAL